MLRELLLGAMTIALLVYFKWPWLAAIVGWLDIGLVLAGLFPKGEPGWKNLLFQFSFDLLFFVASQAGLGSFLALKRWREKLKSSSDDVAQF